MGKSNKSQLTAISMKHITGKFFFIFLCCFGLFSLLGVITGGLAKGCKSEEGGAINKHACRKPNITRKSTFIALWKKKKDVNWLDRAAVQANLRKKQKS